MPPHTLDLHSSVWGINVKLAVTVTHSASERSSDLVFEVEAATLIGEVVRHAGKLFELPDDELTVAFLDTVPVDLLDEIGSGPLLDGAELMIGTPRAYSARPFEHQSSLRIVSGIGAGTVFYLSPGIGVIGTDSRCTLRVGDPDVAPFAAWVSTDASGRVEITPSRDAPLFISGLAVAAATGVDPNTEIRIGNTLFEFAVPQGSDAAITRSDELPRLDYTRPPRLLPPERPSVFKLPTPPKESARRPLPLITALAPIVVAVLMAVLFKQVSFLAFAVLSPIMMIATYTSDRRNGRVSFRKQREDYVILKGRIEADADAALVRERIERRREAPDAATLLEIAVGLRSRLWERRRTDDDYLNVRIGTADLPSEVILEDPEELEHRRGVTRIATEVPVVLDLAARGVVGIAGTNPAAQNLAGWFVGQIAVLQTPRDTSIYVLTDSHSVQNWSWLRWLPHARPAVGQDAAVMIGNDAETLGRRVAELGQIVEARLRASVGTRGRVWADPDIVVIIDGARRLRALPGLIRILKDGPGVGVYAVCIDVDRRLLPEECTAVIVMGPTSVDLFQQRAEDVINARTDVLPEAWFAQVARALSPIVDINDETASGALPGSSRLLDVLQLDPPTENAIVAKWRMGGRTTEVVVGESLDGAFSFDLRRDGPHGLVAGTTGSGKSELLQTIVASLAQANRPDSMTFVLIDYKGGAAFKDCVDLPHTVGMVTDLDTHLVERALESLGAELRRREHLLAVAGAKDIEDYTELSDADPAIQSFPRLLIVIDEFASLARELPDFVSGLVNVAQRGRSLGIHLILATQRPSGVISPEIRANTNLRIALRVTDAAESADVIDAPDSAQISKNTPGRGYIRLGASALLPFQSGRVGGKRRSASAAPSRALWSNETRWEDLGRAAAEPPKIERNTEKETDLQALVQAICRASENMAIPPQHRPWLPALTTSIVLDDINEFALDDSHDTGWSISPIPYGLQDLPALQQQGTAFFDLDSAGHLFIAGAPRSGRSQVLRSIAGAIARNTSAADVHLYALDCGNGALIPLGDMMHTGAVVMRTQTERAQRLLAKLVLETHRRQEILANDGFAGITEQRQNVVAGSRLPHIVLLIDRWEGFLGSLGELDGGALVDQVTMLLREGASLGVHVIIAGDRQLLSSRIGTLVEDKLVLRLSDRGDYSYAGLNAKKLPDVIGEGRGFVAESAIETQVALLTADSTGQAQSAALVELGRMTSARDAWVPRSRRPFHLDVLPSTITFAEAWELRAPERTGLWAMVGVGGDDLLAVGPTLDDGMGAFIVAGAPKSGKSTVLVTMVRSLLAQGAEVVLLAPRLSPLRDLAGTPGVLALITDAEVTADTLENLFPVGRPRRVLVIDDGELVRDTAAKSWYLQFVKSCADHGQAIILGGGIGEVASGITGWQIEMKRGRRGALLSPQATGDGELIGTRLPRSSVGGPVHLGRTILNLTTGGDLLNVQVPVG
ncbi:FtsK/SpoIIIE domain-containing protein [Cryobacterium luteum]|uniref:Cell division protein FtsK n=1 Tax=Cryobacterium luteum TaxID=1424661 RepID=A0A5F0D179_9MICO|nr:FtsK/SpoIIIE domain-containing protein [Cryobacterium luteum]TFB83928.1 cell division protein FtsK [Cryobacterium luteum]